MSMTTPVLPAPDTRLYHLSHTDLDGYGAQYMLRAAGFRARYHNADYRDIPQALDGILNRIHAEGEAATLLITDLNLTVDQADGLARRVASMKVPVQLQLLDHHATGAQAAEKHDWYHLDVERCATVLAFEAAAPHMDEATRARFERRAHFVDVGDRWLKDSADFRRALYLIALVMDEDHLAPPLTDLKRAYRFHLLDGFFERMEAGASLEELERGLYDLRKSFLKGRVEKRLFNEAEIPLNDKFHALSAQVLAAEDMPMLTIDGYRVGVFYNWPHEVWRGVIMELMENQNRMDMAISVRGNGRLSLRANPGVDVGQLSARYFEGGGHPGAAGGSLKETRLRDLPHALRCIQAQVEAVNKAG
ncbi:MAG: DHHA1 domain-containing protein [Halothiobacillaceae bacterium]|nr:DHHA1 domain-containing protein [Halothiobacillaceae bacterium]